MGFTLTVSCDDCGKEIDYDESILCAKCQEKLEIERDDLAAEVRDLEAQVAELEARIKELEAAQ